MTTPSIYDYSDYRSFLKSFAEDKKSASPRWSLGAWARQLDLKGTASLTMVINGQRKPGPKIAESLTRYFRFGKSERRYFEGLIQLEKYKPGSVERIELLNTLRDLVPDHQLKMIDAQEFAAISDWYNYAIRQLTLVRGFRANAKWMKSRFRFNVTEVEIRKSIRLMISMRLLHESNGRLTKTDHDIEAAPQFAAEAIKRYHVTVMELAKRALFEVPLEEREMSALTFAIARERLPEAKKLVSEFKRKMARLANEGVRDSVYQLNVQLFPLTTNESHQQEST